MRIALVNSRQDKAGLNIRHHIGQLLDEGGAGGWQIPGRTYAFYDVEERLIHADAVDREIEADLLVFLSRHCPEGYRVSYEVTHHGPTSLSIPLFFDETASTEKEWGDPVAGRAVAEAVLSAAPVNA